MSLGRSRGAAIGSGPRTIHDVLPLIASMFQIPNIQRRTADRLAGAALVAALAAAIIVPYSATAYSVQAGDSACCCASHRSAQRGSASCCDHATGLATCLSPTCGCRRTPEPQNTPPERTTILESTGGVAYLPSDAVRFHGGVEFASTDEAAPAGHLATIPHRILHCSWLI